MSKPSHPQNRTTSANLRACCIFDGDDTLWQTMPLYEKAKRQYQTIMAELGVAPTFAVEELDKIDARNVARHGFSVMRFPNSLVEAYHSIMQSRCQRTSKSIDGRLFRIGARVFREKATLRQGAAAMLCKLSNRHLVLLTKGDPRVQKRRIAESGLTAYFDAIQIVPTKNKKVFASLIKSEYIDVAQSWSIGDSLKSDILPALEVGLSGLWIRFPTWIYEQMAVPPKTPRLHMCTDLHKVASIIEKEI